MLSFERAYRKGSFAKSICIAYSMAGSHLFFVHKKGCLRKSIGSHLFGAKIGYKDGPYDSLEKETIEKDNCLQCR